MGTAKVRADVRQRAPRESPTPRSMLTRVVVQVVTVASFAIVAGLVFPGAVARRDRVFYDADVRRHLPTTAAARLLSFEQERDRLSAQIGRADSALLQPSALADPTTARELVALREHLARRRDGLRPPVTHYGFYFSRIMLLWPAMLFCLGLLLRPLAPPGQEAVPLVRQAAAAIPLTLLILPLYRWPTWARNFLFYEEGRRAFSPANIDVSPASFVTQEVQSLLIALMLVMLWRQWAAYASTCHAEAEHDRRIPDAQVLSAALDPKRLDRLSRVFVHWQVASVVLAIGFVWYTHFFWDMVTRIGDVRYTVHAIIVHAMWIFSWLCLTAPLAISWYQWRLTKARALAILAGAPPRSTMRTTDDGGAVEVLASYQPISFVNVTTSGIAAIASLVLPLLNGFF
jgi:hypothetical protein